MRCCAGERCRAGVSRRAARRHGYQSSRWCQDPSYGCRIPTEPSTTGESGFRDRARVDGHQFAPSPRPAEIRILLQSYDEGLEFPCLMSHWRTWSTFTTFKAEIGITIQGFSVT